MYKAKRINAISRPLNLVEIARSRIRREPSSRDVSPVQTDVFKEDNYNKVPLPNPKKELARRDA